MAGRLTGKVALVAGAGATPALGMGNGRATAIAMAREGSNVVAVDLRRDRAEATCAAIAAEGGRAIALAADLTQPDGAAAAVSAAVETFGRLDILHHNVGFGGVGDILATTPAEFDRQMGGNARSVFLCMQASLPTMIAQGRGVITTTSSTLAVRAIETANFTYSVAKAAVEAMTRQVAVSYGAKGVRANCIRVGFMDTPLNRAGWRPAFDSEATYEAAIAASANAVPLRRMGDGWDTASLAVFLASDEAAYLNGVVIPLDGGVEHAPIHIPGLPGSSS